MNTYISKGAKLYCPDCGSLILTAKNDVFKQDRILQPEDFEAGEGQVVENDALTACKCGYNYYMAMADNDNWVINDET